MSLPCLPKMVPLRTRSSSSAALLALLCGSLLSLGVGCSTTTPAPGIPETEAALNRSRADETARSRPERVEEARELLRRAKQADARGERERASLLARQALQTFIAAENQQGRDEANAALRAFENSQDKKTPSEPEEAPKPEVLVAWNWEPAKDREVDNPRTPTPPAEQPPRPEARKKEDPLRALAEKALVTLQFKRAESLGLAKDQICPTTFRELDAILELAQKRFDVGDYERAYEFTLRADERFRACDTRDVTAFKKKDDTQQDLAKKKATAALQKAQVELARARSLVPATDPALQQGAALVVDADTWYGRSAYAESEDSATKAQAILVKIKAPVAGKAEAETKDKKVAEKPEDKKANDKKVAEKPEDKKADDKKVAEKPEDKKADDKKVAEKSGDEKADDKKVAEKPDDKKTDATDEKKNEDTKSGKVEPQIVVLTPAQEKVVNERVSAVVTQPGVDPTWKRAYPVVFRALTLRDKAKTAVAGDSAAEASLSETDTRIEAARSAWTSKNYVAAEVAANEAILVYERAIQETELAASEEARNAADAAIREAAIAAQVCETEACEKRDPGKQAAGKELLASARRALDEKRFPKAREDAERARIEFDAALAVARKSAEDEALDATTQKKLEQESLDAFAAANTTRKVCELKSCNKRDAEKWIRVSETLRAADVAKNDGRYARARDLLREADKDMRELLGLPPPFEIPAGVTRIVLSGDQLKVMPALGFTYAGKPTAASNPSVDELAKTLLANKDAIKRIVVVGKAYGKQSAWLQKTADDRGKGLRDALIARGVAADKIDPSGQVAPTGGDTSQLVEIRIELVEAGQ